MLHASNLQKVYRTSDIETLALDNVDLEIRSGEFVSIMGPSGCGKSTLLNLLGLLDRPSRGDLSFLGRNVSSLPERERARLRKGKIGLIYQSFNLIDDLTVAENVELPLLYLKINPAERKVRVQEALGRVGIEHRRDHHPTQLSGGQQQRVAIARAIVASPELILADEPTGNLDSRNGGEIMSLLADLNLAGTTIVMVTHSPIDAEFSQRTIYLYDGRVVPENPIIMERPAPRPALRGI